MRKILSILILIALIVSCKNDEDTNPVKSEFQKAKEFLTNAQTNTILLLDTFHTVAHYNLQFESGDTIRLKKDRVTSLEIDRPNWNTEVTYTNAEVQNVPTVGDSLDILPSDISLNPTGYAPLSAEIDVTMKVDGKFKVTVIGKNGVNSNVEIFPESYQKTHKIQIHGLYPDFVNTVNITFTNENGTPRLSKSFAIQTGTINAGLPDVEVTFSNPNEMEPGLTFVSYRGNSDPHMPCMIDAFGDIRWTVDFSGSSELATLDYDNGMEQLENGNLYFGNQSDHSIYEIDFFGRIVNTWGLSGYEFHHQVYEKPNGNFLVCVDKPGSMHLYGVETIEDYIIEIDRTSGGLITEWDLKQSLDETRFSLKVDTQDWIHVNAVYYDEEDNSIIISGRTQGIIKLSNDNRVKWILSGHRGWGTARNGDVMEDYLMKPLTSAGTEITDTSVVNGTAQHPDFEWCWYQHAPTLLPDGRMIFFDNGSAREFGNTTDVYSRAVIYELDEENLTVRQDWSYGKSRGEDTYSRIVSDADYLPLKDNILFSPGFNVDNGSGTGARIVEVDYQSKQVVFEAKINAKNGLMGLHRAERMSFIR